MTLSSKIVAVLIVLGLTFAGGRYSATSSKSTDVSTTKQQQEEDQTSHTVTVITKAPDGTEKTTTTTDTNTKVTEKDKTTDDKQTVTLKGAKLNVSLLGAIDTSTAGHPLEYGLSVSKEFVGPITAGVWGLNNGTLGVSVGLDF